MNCKSESYLYRLSGEGSLQLQTPVLKEGVQLCLKLLRVYGDDKWWVCRGMHSEKAIYQWDKPIQFTNICIQKVWKALGWIKTNVRQPCTAVPIIHLTKLLMTFIELPRSLSWATHTLSLMNLCPTWPHVLWHVWLFTIYPYESMPHRPHLH